ncbi:MAG: alpha/beta fold hydrolase [Oscillospiraceae bacterium]|nr:alpha/beta fold hydrolase [Oscillospiraceae bacterium]
MKIRSVAAILMSLCMLTGCTSNTGSSDTYEKTTSAAVQTTAGETQKTTEETSSLMLSGASEDIEFIEETDNGARVYIHRDDKKIFSKIYMPDSEGPFPAIIFSAGMGMMYTYTEDYAKKAAENGIAGIVFDFTGTGVLSSGDGTHMDFSALTEAADVNAVYDAVSSLPQIKSDNIFLWGHSLGGLVSTYVTEQRPDDIKGLILADPCYQIQDTFRDLIPEGSEIPDVVKDPSFGAISKMFAEDILSFDIFEKMPDYDKNVLLFQGTVSPCVGLQFPEYFKRASELFPSLTVVTIEGADHRFTDDKGIQMIEKTIEFVNENAG